VTPQQALNHPNWVMGPKITIDSATLMNKGLEVIEAYWLFGAAPEQIEVVIHPQSVIHSMVQYTDGSVVAQLGTPDMRVPIAYGLAWPERIASGAARLDFGTLGALTFEKPDGSRFPGLQLAWDALMGPIGTTAVLNAANEVAVAAFLDQRLRFDQIHAINDATLQALIPSNPNDLSDLLAIDQQARRLAQTQVERLSR
ncbi:MAG: 1-deoxy-D-xylulose-5-phosphate reductoisomerase, partial [Hydrogenophaga sp.]|nr:1-deoxy-D-xylulose-5-phosphate reductoisomerase [Hydrogenophaga sp.]